MRLLVISDLHWAGPEEQARAGHELRVIRNPFLRGIAAIWRRWFWLAEPHRQNHRLEALRARTGAADWVLANGDFTLDSAFVGVSDPAALASSTECLGRLRQAYGERLLTTIGDHDLGKISLFGGAGGIRRESLERCESQLGLRRFWQQPLGGNRQALGITSSLVAWPMFEVEALPEERDWWRRQHEDHLAEIMRAFSDLPSDQRLILCCHDPSALGYLYRIPEIRRQLDRVELTLIGHLHSPLVLGCARRLAGVPRISWLGVTARRYTTALQEARCWRDFRVHLCPSPAGMQLLKDGGWLTVDWRGGESASEVVRHRLPWSSATA